MELRSDLADVKNRVQDGEDNIDESYVIGDIEVNVYIENGYLIIRIPETHGTPFSNDIESVKKVVLTVFGEVMLPDPNTGTVRASIDTENITSS